MKSLNRQKIIKEYSKYAEIQGQCMLDGDYKKGNKMIGKLNVIFDEFQKDTVLAKDVLQELLKSDCFQVRTIAATDCLRLNLFQVEALVVLKESASREDILGFGPEIALKTWKEKGRLDP